MKRFEPVVDDVTISASFHSADYPVADNPVLIALSGGTYTSDYFCIAGSDSGSFVDIATRNGFSVLRINRPGYGGSDSLSDDENTFAHQAELIDAAITAVIDDVDLASAVIVGHSIGGIVGLELAARQPDWPLIGIAVAGMGARIPRGGAAEQLGALPLSGVVDLPYPDREQLWYGPAGSVSDDVIMAARASFAPAPMIELKSAPQWASQRLAEVAASVAVPVHHRLGQFDALWDTSPEAREHFVSNFNQGQSVSSELLPGVGHCVDHHVLGAALHYQQLAFAHQCAHQHVEARSAR